jgi:hypothetical protein
MLLAALLLFHYIQVPVATMREQPSVETKAVSQAIFSEEVKIVEVQEEWVKIATVDSCEGWIRKEMLLERDESYADCSCVKPLVEVKRLMAHVYKQPDVGYGPWFTLPFESRLEIASTYSEDWLTVALPNGEQAYVQGADVSSDTHLLTKEELACFSLRFLNLPFTCGGRSSFGFDSSGLIQMLYRQMGFFLPRTLQEQFAWEGFEPIELQQLEIGDLLFWGASEKEIQQVGMCIADDQFIHVSLRNNQPWVRITNVEEERDWPFYSGRRLKI